MFAASRFLAVLLFSAGAMFAQEQNALRLTAPERAVQMRVQVLYPGGTPVYDSDWKSGNIIDVSELPYGSYQLRISS